MQFDWLDPGNLEIVNLQESVVWKTKFIGMNKKLLANEINQSMKDTELVGSRPVKIIIAEWNCVPKSSKTDKIGTCSTDIVWFFVSM